MAITFDTANAVIDEGPDDGGLYNSSAISFAVNANGADMLLLFICALCDNSLDLSGALVQYAGSQEFTEIGVANNTQTPGGSAWAGYITSPTAGSNNVTFTLAASSGDVNSYVALAMPCSGMDTGTPTDTGEYADMTDGVTIIGSASYGPTANTAGDVAVLMLASRDAVDGQVRPILEGSGDTELLNGVTGAVSSTGPDGYCAISDSSSPSSTSDCTLWVAYEAASGAGTVTVAGTMGESDRAAWLGFLLNVASASSGNPHYYYAQQ